MRVERRERGCPEAVVGMHGLEQRVDNRVAGQVDVRGGNSLSDERRRAPAGVGAKCSAASRVVSTRFISSGNGC